MYLIYSDFPHLWCIIIIGSECIFHWLVHSVLGMSCIYSCEYGCQRLLSGAFLCWSSIYVWNQAVSLTEIGPQWLAWRGWLANELWIPSFSAFPTSTHWELCFSVSAEDLNSGLHSCATVTFLTKHLPSLYVLILDS